VVSVGAVFDTTRDDFTSDDCSQADPIADMVACFSNAASGLTMLAPGVEVTAAGKTLTGTSQAAPHVAGAFAVLRALFPADTVARTTNRLTSTGVAVTDTRNHLTFPRLSLSHAIHACVTHVSPNPVVFSRFGGTQTVTVTADPGCEWTPSETESWLSVFRATVRTGSGTFNVTAAPKWKPGLRTTSIPIRNLVVEVRQDNDRTSPTASISIDEGTAWTRRAGVRLTLSASDPSGIAAMCISESADCTDWVPYATSMDWTLTGADGQKTVHAAFRDVFGNMATVSDTIGLDRTAPANGTLSFVGTATRITLTMNDATDALSGIARYRFVRGDASAPSDCSTGTLLYEGTSNRHSATGLITGHRYFFRGCAIDHIGNMAPGVAIMAYPAPEYTPPTGSVLINDGAAWTTSAEVTLALSATDNRAVSEMCVSNTNHLASCAPWVSYATTTSHSLAPHPPGVRRIHVWFRDINGNISTAAHDAIVLDGVGPTNGRLTATGSGKQVTLDVTGVSDMPAGVASHKLLFTLGKMPPADCESGTLLVEGAGVFAGFTHARPFAGVSHGYRLCHVDAYGNTNNGATAVHGPTSEQPKPPESGHP
jgi:hypothetical protein